MVSVNEEPSTKKNKPVSPPRVSSPPSKWWKLHLLAEVAAAVSEYQNRGTNWRRRKSENLCEFPKKEEKSLSLSWIIFFDGNTILTPLSSGVNECKKRRPINFSQERSLKKRRIVQKTTIPERLVNVMMMRGEINGYDPKLILVKKLYKSDIDKVQSRLVAFEPSGSGRWVEDGTTSSLMVGTKLSPPTRLRSATSIMSGLSCFALVPPRNSSDSGDGHGGSSSCLSSW
ncbi:hypothetical protein Bca52824_058574 [Brassica carinata]|uniref:Uncharacterized protein n=1 Tax=Brassica carinata TaxID=52824 RepID=A0A8X7QSN7_BRACI|nr:hypothetical protein Bca52824_058574 [Brassica carinata]